MASFRRPRIMGIINCTPDSFYADSRYMEHSEIVKTAKLMVAEGAAIIDVGGESTRPGANGVEAEEQIARAVPAIRAIRSCLSVDISIDTQSSVVAEAALDAGATIINDISALRTDSRMAPLAAEREASVILMHMKGTPATMQNNPGYGNVVMEVRDFLLKAVERGITGGIDSSSLILDPGIGFGKRVQDNVSLIKNLSELKLTGFPVLLGVSRKSFLASLLSHDEGGPRPPEGRLAGTAAAHAWSLSQGVDILRVHDVKETKDLIDIWEAIEWAS